MAEPRPGWTTFLIMVSPLPGKYEFYTDPEGEHLREPYFQWRRELTSLHMVHHDLNSPSTLNSRSVWTIAPQVIIIMITDHWQLHLDSWAFWWHAAHCRANGWSLVELPLARSPARSEWNLCQMGGGRISTRTPSPTQNSILPTPLDVQRGVAGIHLTPQLVSLASDGPQSDKSCSEL